MSDKEFLNKYEDLLNKNYCNCNEMNCIDNNSPRRILNIAKRQQEEIERLNNRIDKAIEYIENVEEDYIACERSGFYEYQDKTRCLNYEDVEQKLYNILRGEDNE